MSAPVVFISYSYDSEDHETWVESFAKDLRSNGIDAILDKWDLHPGADIAKFMARGIKEADRVLLVCTERYVEKAEGGAGGVGYEGAIITTELVRTIETKKFIPIVRDQSDPPQFLGPRKHIDFSRTEEYEARLKELLLELHGEAEKRKPPLGESPFSGTPCSDTFKQPAPGSPTRAIDTHWLESHLKRGRSGLAKLGIRASMEIEMHPGFLAPRPQTQLLDAIRQSQIQHFGWPIGIVLDHHEDARPRPVQDGIFAEVAIEDLGFGGGPSYDYWALNERGDFCLTKSLFEDQRAKEAIFFNTRIVRVTETLLFAEALYKRLGVPANQAVSIRITHRGLKGRTLTSSNLGRHLLPRTSTEDVCTVNTTITLSDLDTRLNEYVMTLCAPLFMLFDFMKFDPSVYEGLVSDFCRGKVS